MAVFSELSMSPRPGRRNALPNIFDGLDGGALDRLRQSTPEREQQEEEEGRQDAHWQRPVNGTGNTESAFLDLLHSSRYRQRRNAIPNVAETVDTSTLRLHLNHYMPHSDSDLVS